MKKKITRKILLASSISVVLFTASLGLHAKPAFDFDPANGVFPEGKFKEKYNKLSQISKIRAKKWLKRVRTKEKDLKYLNLDAEGGVFYVDTFLPDSTESEATEPNSTQQIDLAGDTDVFSLHSKPGAANVIYLDFDGHLISGTAWSGSDLQAVAYDLDGNTNDFSQAEKNNIASVWRRVAEDYAPFDVDITTEEPASFGPTVGRLLITKDVDANGNPMPAQGAGGVAYVGVFGISNYATRYSPAFVYYDNLGGGRADYVAEATSHEAGHNLGLSHDATSTSSYYGGHGSGNVSWGPIMGVGYNRNVSQWSKGEYTDASQTEDDVSLLGNLINWRSDDHGDQSSQATPLVLDANGNVIATTPLTDPDNTITANKGIINSRDDIDVFSFTTAGGDVILQATPLQEASNTRGGNLDVQLSLYDDAGTLVESSDPADETNAGISATLAEGVYYLSVQGVGSTHYTDYGSLGQYFLDGAITPSEPRNDTEGPTPNPMGWAVAPAAIDRFSIAMTAVTATDESSSVEYNFICQSDVNHCVDSGWQASSQFTASHLMPSSTYSFTVKARDTAGNETVESAALSATTTDNTAPQAVDDAGTTNNVTPLTVNVLTNDNDADGDQLKVTHVTQASNGTVGFTDSAVSYTANAAFVGTDNFTYTVDDGYGGTTSATVTVEVTAAPAVNQPPTAEDDSYSVTPRSTTLFDVLANDADPDNDQLTIIELKNAKRRRVKIVDNKISYRSKRRTGTETFSYVVSDGQGNTSTATVTVENAIIGQVPEAGNDSFTVAPGSTTMLDVLINDADADNDQLKINKLKKARKRRVKIVDNQISYRAKKTAGIETFSYIVDDGNGNTSIATVTVTVQ